MFTLHNGDCLQILPSIPSGSIDAIITDLPYGTTACEWDSIIPLAPMWEQVKRVLKPNGVFITTCSQPFTSVLICSNLPMFRYEWIWDKKYAGNFAAAEYVPMKEHENVAVFYSKAPTYNAEMMKKTKSGIERAKSPDKPFEMRDDNVYGRFGFQDKQVTRRRNPTMRNPRSIIEFMRENGLHPTQKPVSLYRYLIRTYTNEGETVLDIAMGSGTTIEAAIIEGRYSIGIEKDTEFGYFQVAEKRAKSAVLQQRLFTPSNNRLHLDVGDSPAQQALFTPEADTAEGKLPAPAPRR
jgi:site-specific DNA-methyltransferase (adenine-specific)